MKTSRPTDEATLKDKAASFGASAALIGTVVTCVGGLTLNPHIALGGGLIAGGGLGGAVIAYAWANSGRPDSTGTAPDHGSEADSEA